MEDRVPVYLNNAATTWPKPPSVIESVSRSFEKPFAEHGRSSFSDQKDFPFECRKTLASFFGNVIPEHISFTSSATDAINMLIHGFIRQYTSQVHVITSRLEHNSVLRPLRALEQQGRIDLSIIPFNDQGKIERDAVEDAIDGRTKMAVLTHGSNVLGSIQDIDAIGQALREKEIFVIADGAQTAGAIPVDLTTLPVDAYAFTGHKALFGFPGVGGFYIKDPSLVLPVRQGGTGVRSQDPLHPLDMPLRYESGTHNYPGIVSLMEGVRYLQSNGLEALCEKTSELTKALVKGLETIDNVVIYNPAPSLPVVACNVEGLPNDDVGTILSRSFNIIARTGLHCSPLVHKDMDDGKGCIRFSLSCLNTMDEIEAAIDAMRQIAGSTN